MSEAGSSHDGPVFSPELEGLLREIAADPGSRLLRVPRPKVVAGYLDRSLVSRDAARASTLAEKELLRVHREELALALREACLVRFYEDPEGVRYLHHHRSREGGPGLPSRASWTASARETLTAARLDQVDLPHSELLDLCLHPLGTPQPSIVQIARAAQTLIPSDTSECHEGLALVLEGNYPVGGRMLADLALRRATRRISSHAFESVGLAFGLAGDDVSALGHYRRAWELAPNRSEPVVAWLVCAATTMNRAELARAAGVLDELARQDDPAVRELVAMKISQRDLGQLVPSEATKGLVARLRDSFGPASESVLNVLA